MVSSGWGREEIGRVLLTSMGFSFWNDENVLEIEVMVVQHCECLKCH